MSILKLFLGKKSEKGKKCKTKENFFKLASKKNMYTNFFYKNMKF